MAFAVLPDPPLFLYSYVRKEAVLSSQIEGTQSSLSDLLLYELKGHPAHRWTMRARFLATFRRWKPDSSVWQRG